MNQKMLEYWEYLKKRDFEYLNEVVDINDDYIRAAFETTEKILAECKEVRNNPKKAHDIFIEESHYDPYYDGDYDNSSQGNIRGDIDMKWEGPSVLKWIYGLTKIDKTYKYANQTVGWILRDLYGDKFEKEEEKEYKLYKLLKKEKEQQNTKKPQNILPQTTINKFTITPNTLHVNRKDKNRKIEDKSNLIKKEEHETKVKKFIKDKFQEIDKNGWNYVFRYEADYNKFIDLFTAFFTGVLCTLHTEINLKKGCKTRFSPILGMIHKEFSQVILKNDKEYFQILKILNVFKKLTDNQIYKDITRESERI